MQIHSALGSVSIFSLLLLIPMFQYAQKEKTGDPLKVKVNQDCFHF